MINKQIFEYNINLFTSYMSLCDFNLTEGSHSIIHSMCEGVITYVFEYASGRTFFELHSNIVITVHRLIGLPVSLSERHVGGSYNLFVRALTFHLNNAYYLVWVCRHSSRLCSYSGMVVLSWYASCIDYLQTLIRLKD